TWGFLSGERIHCDGKILLRRGGAISDRIGSFQVSALEKGGGNLNALRQRRSVDGLAFPILALAFSASAFAQQPQTYLEGTGTASGLAPTGLGNATLTIASGSVLCAGALSSL